MEKLLSGKFVVVGFKDACSSLKKGSIHTFINGIADEINGTFGSLEELNRRCSANFEPYKEPTPRMTKEEFDGKYVGEDIAVNCPTEELANEFLKEADSHGYKWGTGDSYFGENNWDYYKEKTLYGIFRGRYGTKFGFKGCNTVEFKGFESNKTLSITELKLEKGKFYKDEEGYIYKTTGYDLKCETEHQLITDLLTLEQLRYKKFTEVNPNQERIDQLKELIKERNVALRQIGEQAEEQMHLISGYEAELKELEG